MWKIFAGLFGFFAMASIVSSGLRGARIDPAEASKPLDEVLQSAAEGLKERRGDVINGMIFDDVAVRGNTIIFEIIIPRPPRRFNAEDASIRGTRDMAALYCDKLAPILRRGVVIVHRFKSKTGLELVDSRLDASACGLTG